MSSYVSDNKSEVLKAHWAYVKLLARLKSTAKQNVLKLLEYLDICPKFNLHHKQNQNVE